MRILILFLMAAAGAAQAEPIAALQPMAFLAGHCWKGQLANGKGSDEHCFQWIYDGRALRDVHTVRQANKPDYVGETTYYYDAAAKKVEYLYIENAGGISRGEMRSVDGALVFPPTQYIAEGMSLTHRVRWTPIGSDAYEAWSESKTKDGWSTMFKMVLSRSAP